MRLRWRPEEDPRRKRHAGASRGTRDTGEPRVQVSDAPPRVAAARALALDGCGLRVLSLRPSLAEPALPSSAGAAPPPGRPGPCFGIFTAFPGDLAPMEAEEPEHGASAPSPAIADFPTVPGAIMRSSQIPSLEPEAQEGQDPSYMWADGHGLLLKQPKDLKNMSDHPPDSVGFFSKEVSSDVESSQEILVAEACDTPDLQEAVSQSLQDRLSRTIAAPELLACGGQEEWLDKSNQLDSRVEAELQPELMSLTLSIRTAKEEEETPPDTSTARGSWPPCRKHPGETEQSEGQGSELRRQGKQPQLEDTQEKQGQDGLLHPLEEQEGQEVEIQEEGTLREDICSDGLLGEQEEEGEEVNGNEDEQKQDKDQNHIMLGTQRESEGLSGELGGLDYSECGQEDWDRKVQGQRDSEEEGQGREFREVEERRANVQFAEEQRLVVQSENGSGKQAEHGEAGKAVPVEGQEEVLDSEGPSDPHDSQLWSSPQSSTLATGSPVPASSPSTVSMDMRIHETLPPPPPVKRHSYSSVMERDRHLHAVSPALKRHSHPSPLALSSGLHGSPKGPFPLVPDSVVARQHRPLPSTPEDPHHAQTSIPPRLRYNKPLPPTPDAPELCHSLSSSSSVPKKYRPLPPVPPSEPPPLPPKSRERSRSIQWGVRHPGGQANPRPTGQDWTASTLSVGRTSWPPATGRSTDSLAATSRSNSEVSPGLAFSNMTNLLCPSSPTTPWIPQLQRPASKDELGFPEESESPVRGSLRRSGPQERYNDTRRSSLGPTKQSEKPIHHQLEKTSSCPDRQDPVRTEGGSELAVSQASNKLKSWNRQGLRRPSLSPESASNLRNSGMGRPPGSSDSVVFRIFSSHESSPTAQLLYQEYSDVVLNKEIQSQQRLDSLAEGPGVSSPRQRRKAVVPSDSYLQRLSMASSGSLWQEIPVVRNSTVLLSMTHEDQKLQEAKFELIVSEASYLRSLNIAVDHFQHSVQLRASLSAQDHQWLFSRLQDVRDVSTTFLSDLEENFENNIFSFQVCDVVLNHAPEFRRVYLPYVTNQTYQERTFQSLMNSNSSFREVLEKLESDPICQRLSLKSFLILPFQRITRLKLLLQNILKRTQPGSSEEAEATKAHHALEKLIRDCNSNVQRMRRTEELIYLSQKIEFECKIFPLISQSRWLVKSGELTVLEFSASPGLRRKLTTRPVHLHLFNDCLLLSRPREGNRFLVFDHAPFSSIRGEKCEMKLHGAHKNLFRLFLLPNAQGAQVEFLFRTETQSEKLRWISALAMPREELDLLECYDSPQVQCLRAYKPRENDELALEKADVVMVTQQSSDGWLEGVRLSDGERGWFPIQQVEFISNSEVRAQNLKEAHRVKTAKLQLVEQQV
ncbi:hypothetical protein U0070_012865 [Myodes glareolus]|uniref:Rho guanine nucleotide exchange factor 5 n=1 Tax=Myodes glareolus TaxID=447135 RepID=A0AAW0ID49_MYOGA